MDFYGHIIDNAEVPSLDGQTMEDIDPYTRQPWATIACGGRADADRAVAAANTAVHGRRATATHKPLVRRP